VGWDGMVRIVLAQVSDRWQALLYVVLNFRSP
jgi:hypothetical protein